MQDSLCSNTLIEVSTADSVEDNYRIAPGDSQTKKVKNGTENIPS